MHVFVNTILIEAKRGFCTNFDLYWGISLGGVADISSSALSCLSRQTKLRGSLQYRDFEEWVYYCAITTITRSSSL